MSLGLVADRHGSCTAGLALTGRTWKRPAGPVTVSYDRCGGPVCIRIAPDYSTTGVALLSRTRQGDCSPDMFAKVNIDEVDRVIPIEIDAEELGEFSTIVWARFSPRTGYRGIDVVYDFVQDGRILTLSRPVHIADTMGSNGCRVYRHSFVFEDRP